MMTKYYAVSFRVVKSVEEVSVTSIKRKFQREVSTVFYTRRGLSAVNAARFQHRRGFRHSWPSRSRRVTARR